MNRSTSWLTVLPSLIIPTCLGLIMYLGMAALLERDVITDPTTIRYLTGHWVCSVTMILFFVGVGSLAIITVDVFGQWGAANKIHFGDPSPAQLPSEINAHAVREMSDKDEEPASVRQAFELGHQLLNMPKRFREHYLWQRLHESLHFVHRTGSAKGLENETKYLSEMDLDQQEERYSLVRILIWATPMLGFLGTVLGISQALGGINVGPENDFQKMMDGLRSSLNVAFDTTALALILSMALMFGQFVVDRIAMQLLKFVDYRTRQELSARFDMSAASEFDAVEKMGLTVLATADQLVQRQSELWHKSICIAEKAWEDSITGVNDQVRDNLATALEQTVEKMSSTIGSTIQKADDSMAHRWQQWQVTLSDSARSMKEQQRELNSQTRLIKDLVDSVTIKVLDPAVSNRAKTAASTVSNSAGQPPAAVEPVLVSETYTSVPRNAAMSPSPHIYFSTFTEEIAVVTTDAPNTVTPAADIKRQDYSPDIITTQASDLSLLRLFDPDASGGDDACPALAAEISAAPVNMPRYRYAEQLAGVDPVVLFPVQIDSKKAA